MSGVVAAVKCEVPAGCQASRCRRPGCSVSMAGLPEDYVLVDLDCPELDISPDGKRCDYVFVGGDEDAMWVAPIELKSGRFKVSEVKKQLKGGTDVAAAWLPRQDGFRFVPVLVYGGGMHKQERNALGRVKITLHGRTRRAVWIRCGGALKDALSKA